MYSEIIFRESLEDISAGMMNNGKTIGNLSYADDNVVIASSILDIRSMMVLILERSKRYGLFVNVD